MKGNRGITLIGFVIVVAIVGMLGIVAFRAIPLYSEYFSIKRIVKQINVESPDTTPNQIRGQFELKAAADYVYSVRSRDLDISKENGRIVISVTYQKIVPLLYNVSLLFDFETSNRK